jgi:hypothetical protein
MSDARFERASMLLFLDGFVEGAGLVIHLAQLGRRFGYEQHRLRELGFP